MSVYAARMRASAPPAIFEAEQQHTAYDDGGRPSEANRQVVRYLSDGTQVIEWQRRWMRFAGITARTVSTVDGRQHAYLDPVPIALRTTRAMSVPMIRKAFPSYAPTCSIESGDRVVRQELTHGYRTAVIERFEPGMAMRVLLWRAIDAACTTLKTEIYKQASPGWQLTYGLNTIRITPAEASTPVFAQLF
jgi:hypothetical protein